MENYSKEVDLDLLRRQLISIYEAYVKSFDFRIGEKEARAFSEEARRVYFYYYHLDAFLDERTAYALRFLIDIFADTGVRVSKERALDLLKGLKDSLKESDKEKNS